jgi:hypothetical protein
MEYDRPQGRVWTKTRGKGCVGRLGRVHGVVVGLNRRGILFVETEP